MKSPLILALGLLASPASATPEVELVRVPGDGLQPVAEMDATGNLHLVYFRGDPAHGDLFHSVRQRGSAEFREPVRVNMEDSSAIAIGTIRGARLALGRGSRVHIAWMGSSEVTPGGDHQRTPMLYARSTDGGKHFEPERNLITTAYGLDGGGAIAADAGGRVEVFWHAGAPDAREPGRKVWVSRSSDDGATFSPETAAWDEPTGVCGCCGMTAAAGAGHFWALYRSAGERVHRDIYLLRSDRDGDGFSGRRLDQWQIDACPMSAMSLAFAGTKTAAAWEAKDGDIAFTIEGTELRGRVPHGNVARKYPSVALAPDGHVLLAWIDGAGWQKAGRLGWQLFDPQGSPVGDPEIGPATAVWTKPAAVYEGETFLIVY